MYPSTSRGEMYDLLKEFYKTGAHYQASISYAQAIKDVRDLFGNGESFEPYLYHGDFEKHFSTELKSLENGGKE